MDGLMMFKHLVCCIVPYSSGSKHAIADSCGGMFLQNCYSLFNNRECFTQNSFLAICLHSTIEITVTDLECRSLAETSGLFEI